MKINRLFSIAAAALMMVACSSEDTALKNTPAAGPQMQFTATIAAPNSGATTRTEYTEVTTGEAAGTISVAWKVGDEIALIHNGVKDVATVKAVNANGSATIAGIITKAENGDGVEVCYPAAAWEWYAEKSCAIRNETFVTNITTKQDGTLKYIQDNLDTRMGKGTLKVDGDNATLSASATLESQIAIWKLALQDDAETPAPLSATQVSVKKGGEQPVPLAGTTTLGTATSTVYLAIDKFSDQKVTIEATVGDNTYKYEKEGVSLALGQYYQSTVTMKVDPQAIPLTLEAITAGTIKVTSPKEGMQYSKNGGEKTTMTGTTEITVDNIGDKVAFYGNGTSIAIYSGTVITGSGDGFKCKVYGNIMSLIDEENFATTTPSLTTSCFKSLFNSNSYLTDASGLLLPATTLANSCYQGMFYGCTGLTTAPALPATTLAVNCYSSMFAGCSSLTTAPTLPATTMASSCYGSMFYHCTSLTTAPALPATTLANNCYYCMFSGCTGLTTAPNLPATTMQTGCYQQMFQGCTGLTTAPELPAKTLAGSCYKQMFYGCTGLTTAPEELPATTLPGGGSCYQQMFQGCTSLTATPKLPATSLTMNCYKQMFQGCTGLTKAYVKAAYTTNSSACTDMFKGCTNASTSTFYSDNAAGWKNAFSDNLRDWQAEAYPVTLLSVNCAGTILYYVSGETYKEAVENHSENTTNGWGYIESSLTGYGHETLNYVIVNSKRILSYSHDWDEDWIDPSWSVDPSLSYTWFSY